MAESGSLHRRWRTRLTPLLAVVVVAAGIGAWTGVLPVLRSDDGADPMIAAQGPAPDDAATSPVVDGDRQAAIVEAEDARLLDVISTVPFGAQPYEVAPGPSSLPTVVLTARAQPYDLAALQRLGAVELQPDGAWLMRRSVVATTGATLRIEAPGATLRMAGGPDGSASLIGFKGSLLLAGGPGAPMTVTSWDVARGGPDIDVADGRPYIRAVGSRMDLTDVAVSDLGFWSGRTGGLAWTGSAGEPATGSMTDTTVDRDQYGVFTSRAEKLVITGGALRDNAMDGLLLHRDTANLTAKGVTVTGNGRDGIVATRGAQNIALAAVTVSANRGRGVYLDGSPLADQATASGAALASGSGYRVERSTVLDNGEEGVLISDGGAVSVVGNEISGNRDGIVVRDAQAPVLTGNTVDAAGFGVAVRGGTVGAQLQGNSVRAAVIGIQVSDATAALTGNTVLGASRYAVSLVGAVGGSVVTDNALGGRGLAALDTNRISPTATADLVGNDETGWRNDRDLVADTVDYVSGHPLAWLWSLILLLPVAARLWSRRRRDALHPYANVAPGPPLAAPGPVVATPDRPSPRPRGTRITVVPGR